MSLHVGMFSKPVAIGRRRKQIMEKRHGQTHKPSVPYYMTAEHFHDPTCTLGFKRILNCLCTDPPNTI